MPTYEVWWRVCDYATIIMRFFDEAQAAAYFDEIRTGVSAELRAHERHGLRTRRRREF